MTYPTAAVNTANVDASTDSPATARSDILDAIQKLNQMIAHTTAFAAALLDDVDADAARATLGALGASDTIANATTAASCSGNAATATTADNLGGVAASGYARSGANTDITSVKGVAIDNLTSKGSGNCSAGSSGNGFFSSGNQNTYFGSSAGSGVYAGSGNTYLGNSTGPFLFNATQCTYVGAGANELTADRTNCSLFGYNTQVSGNNQVQLGNSATTTYVYGTVQNRSDVRDKADVRDTVLGLDFVNALRPVDYRWDMREDYRPTPPQWSPLADDATEAEKTARTAEIADYIQASALENVVRDGSKKRTRYHHGLIAQEVEEVISATGVDFGGFQSHSISGGVDVLSLGYDELIAPLIKAIQELTARVALLEARQ